VGQGAIAPEREREEAPKEGMENFFVGSSEGGDIGVGRRVHVTMCTRKSCDSTNTYWVLVSSK
jgi:hypothetical protein